ncbi:hypothetical protein GCM10009817_39800 [Terrabacter lapilli]|uniref:DUF732 domain-containing protein n=1 Tax=Terrabacter lapilli TaxID=436231 RepID=A0ABP5E970_9MICO
MSEQQQEPPEKKGKGLLIGGGAVLAMIAIALAFGPGRAAPTPAATPTTTTTTTNTSQYDAPAIADPINPPNDADIQRMAMNQMWDNIPDSMRREMCRGWNKNGALQDAYLDAFMSSAPSFDRYDVRAYFTSKCLYE